MVWVPGAFELLTVQRLAESGDYAIICLGCADQGETMHFEHIAESVAHALAQVALQSAFQSRSAC